MNVKQMWQLAAIPLKIKLTQFSHEEPAHVRNISLVENNKHALLIYLSGLPNIISNIMYPGSTNLNT